MDQWQKLHLGLDALSNQKILKGIYYTQAESSLEVLLLGVFPDLLAFFLVLIGTKQLTRWPLSILAFGQHHFRF